MPEPSREPGTPRPLRVALVGCGEAGLQKHLRVLADISEIEVAVLVDEDGDVARRTAESRGIPRWTSRLDEVLSDESVTAVAVIVPPSAHANVAVAALEAGRHVLVEKPLALCLDDARRIQQSARTARGVAMMAFHMRFHRLVREARRRIRAGDIGSIESIRSVWNAPRGDDGLPPWRWRRSTGGGALVEVGVHHFDLWSFLADRPTRTMFARAESGTREDERAIVSATLADGILATGSFSERAPHAVAIDVAGDEGRMEIDCLRFDGLRTLRCGSDPGRPHERASAMLSTLRRLPHGLREMRKGGVYLDSYREMWRHFVSAIVDGAPVESTIEDGVVALGTVLAATESASAGREVEVDQAPSSFRPEKRPER